MDSRIPRGRKRSPIPEPFKRTRGNSTIYYYAIYDSDNVRRQLSTGCTTKSAAREFIKARLLEGQLIPTKEILFSAYAQDFYSKDSPWFQTRNRKGAKGVSEEHLADMARLTRMYLVPAWGKKALDRIYAQDIDALMGEVLKDRATSTVKHLFQAAAGIFTEAFRAKLIPENPMTKAHPVTVVYKEKGIFELADIVKLLDPSRWGLRRQYLFNLLACVTGARMGELLALKGEDFEKDRVTIGRRFRRIEGVTEGTKAGDSREIPCPAVLCQEIKSLGDGYLFAADPKGGAVLAPWSHKAVETYFDSVCESAKLERKARNITFHSWRHFFNTFCLARSVPVHKVQHTMGHSQGGSMTFHYAHFTAADMAEVYDSQDEILKAVKYGILLDSPGGPGPGCSWP